MSWLYDKTGRKVVPGDILKVFHFVGRRRKHYFMYKQVLAEVRLNEASPHRYLKVSHLTFDQLDYYWELLDERVMEHWEIVQSLDANFEARPRLAREG